MVVSLPLEIAYIQSYKPNIFTLVGCKVTKNNEAYLDAYYEDFTNFRANHFSELIKNKPNKFKVLSMYDDDLNNRSAEYKWVFKLLNLYSPEDQGVYTFNYSKMTPEE